MDGLGLAPSAEQLAFGAAVRSALVEAVAAASSDDGERLISERARELGLFSLGLSGPYGGDGTLMDAAVVTEELGRIPVEVPFVGQFLTGLALRASPVPEDVLASIADGRRRVTVAVDQDGRSAQTVRCTPTHGGCSLSGQIPFVIDAAGAHDLVIVSRSGSGEHAHLASVDQPGVEVTALPVLDITQRFGMLTLDGARSGMIVDDGPDIAIRARRRLYVLLAAAATGAAAGAFEACKRYVVQREQFGRLIGSFQIVQHKLVDMLVAVENARSATWTAARATDDGSDEAGVAAAMAKAVATENATLVTSEAIQLHGALGFTWEVGLHHLLRRAKFLELVYGDVEYHYRWIGARLLSGEVRDGVISAAI
jgi:alkylation response protein AidB-like acyl-CoA dehydrogenase